MPADRPRPRSVARRLVLGGACSRRSTDEGWRPTRSTCPAMEPPTLPLADLHGDADHVGAVLDRLALTDVVLVGHSYGGAVITDAAAGRTDLAHLVYLTAFALLDGESVMDPLGSLPPETDGVAGVHAGRRRRHVHDRPGRRRRRVLRRVPAAVAAAAVARLGAQPMSTFTQPVRAASSTIPSTYVFCARDEAIHPHHQAHLAAAVRDPGRSRHRPLADAQRRRRTRRHPRRSRHVRPGRPQAEASR